MQTKCLVVWFILWLEVVLYSKEEHKLPMFEKNVPIKTCGYPKRRMEDFGNEVYSTNRNVVVCTDHLVLAVNLKIEGCLEMQHYGRNLERLY